MELIALYPWENNLLNNNIFNKDNLYNLLPNNEVYKDSNPFKLLKGTFERQHYNFMTIDKIDNIENAKYIIFFDMPELKNEYFVKCIKNNLKEKMILFLWEPNVVKPRNYDLELHSYFKLIFTWNDDLVDNKKYYKFNFPQPGEVINPYKKTFHQKKFCTLIAGNKSSKIPNELYSERLKIINFFEKENIVAFEYYGRGWRTSKITGARSMLRYLRLILLHKYKSYKGETDNKLKTLSEYKFCICYENEKNVNGYITEKIFDCFFAGTVPIYLGAENITNYIPEGCFIDRRNFANDLELYLFMKSIDEQEYLIYIKNIEEFLKSNQFIQFSDTFFAKNIARSVIENI
jgi:alpha(1,3/1,4) fucosyltransferase